MIKRDTIQRYTATVAEDSMGGQSVSYSPAEIITANVSVNATFGDIQQFGITNEMVIHIVTNVKLDQYIYTRYEYSGKMFRLVRQIKQGNEFFSTLVEVKEEH